MDNYKIIFGNINELPDDIVLGDRIYLQTPKEDNGGYVFLESKLVGILKELNLNP